MFNLKILDFKIFKFLTLYASFLILLSDLVNKLDRPNPTRKAFKAIKVLH